MLPMSSFFILFMLLFNAVRRTVGLNGNDAVAVRPIDVDMVFLKGLQGRFMREFIGIIDAAGNGRRLGGYGLDEASDDEVLLPW